jgi:hypothetical protein
MAFTANAICPSGALLRVLTLGRYCQAHEQNCKSDTLHRAILLKSNADLPEGRKYPILYADPPWQYEHPPMGENRAIENHSPNRPWTPFISRSGPEIGPPITEDNGIATRNLASMRVRYWAGNPTPEKNPASATPRANHMGKREERDEPPCDLPQHRFPLRIHRSPGVSTRSFPPLATLRQWASESTLFALRHLLGTRLGSARGPPPDGVC